MGRLIRPGLALLAAAAVSVATTSCHTSSTTKQSVVVTPAAPTNLAAAAGFKSVSLTWSLVNNATGYRVYVSPNAITSTSGMPGIFVVSSPFQLTGQPDWAPLHIRVAAVIDTLQGPLSSEVQATPNGGWVMATSSSAGNSLSWFEADADGVLAPFPTPNTIKGGQVVATVGTGVIYSISSGGNIVEVGFATAAGTTPYVAHTPGHSVLRFGRAGTPERQIVVDQVAGGKATISSFPTTGGPGVEIIGGCTSVSHFALAAVGAILECDQSGAVTYYQTDGISSGVQLTGTPASYIPLGMSAVAAYYFDNITHGTAVQEITTPFTVTKLGLTNGTPFFAGDTVEELAAVGSGAATDFGLLIHVAAGGVDGFELCELNGSGCLGNPGETAATDNGFQVLGLTSDGKSALILGTQASFNAFLMQMSKAAGAYVSECSASVCTAGALATDVEFLPPSPLGPLKVAALNSAGWHLVDQDTGLNDVDLGAGTIGNSLVGAEDGFVLLYDAVGGPSLKAYPYAGGTPVTLSANNASNTSPLLYPNLSMIWLANDGTTFLGTPDGTTIAPTRVDSSNATAVSNPSTSSDGRLFWNATRLGPPAFSQVMSWTPGAAAAVVVAGTNGNSVTGTFIPQ